MAKVSFLLVLHPRNFINTSYNVSTEKLECHREEALNTIRIKYLPKIPYMQLINTNVGK